MQYKALFLSLAAYLCINAAETATNFTLYLKNNNNLLISSDKNSIDTILLEDWKDFVTFSQTLEDMFSDVPEDQSDFSLPAITKFGLQKLLEYAKIRFNIAKKETYFKTLNSLTFAQLNEIIESYLWLNIKDETLLAKLIEILYRKISSQSSLSTFDINLKNITNVDVKKLLTNYMMNHLNEIDTFKWLTDNISHPPLTVQELPTPSTYSSIRFDENGDIVLLSFDAQSLIFKKIDGRIIKTFAIPGIKQLVASKDLSKIIYRTQNEIMLYDVLRDQVSKLHDLNFYESLTMGINENGAFAFLPFGANTFSLVDLITNKKLIYVTLPEKKYIFDVDITTHKDTVYCLMLTHPPYNTAGIIQYSSSQNKAVNLKNIVFQGNKLRVNQIILNDTNAIVLATDTSNIGFKNQVRLYDLELLAQPEIKDNFITYYLKIDDELPYMYNNLSNKQLIFADRYKSRLFSVKLPEQLTEILKKLTLEQITAIDKIINFLTQSTTIQLSLDEINTLRPIIESIPSKYDYIKLFILRKLRDLQLKSR